MCYRTRKKNGQLSYQEADRAVIIKQTFSRNDWFPQFTYDFNNQRIRYFLFLFFFCLSPLVVQGNLYYDELSKITVMTKVLTSILVHF